MTHHSSQLSFDMVRFFELVDGRAPTRADYAGFASVIDCLDADQLWALVRRGKDMNYFLVAAVQSRLFQIGERVPVEIDLEQLYARLRQ